MKMHMMSDVQVTSKKVRHVIGGMTGLLLFIFCMRTFFFVIYQVPTGSMEATMLVGERFFADKFSMWLRFPQRGEIIAFNDVRFPYSSHPLIRFFQEYIWGPIDFCKRVIGVPGDRVRGVIEGGKPVIYINDVRLDEPYLNPYPLLGIWNKGQHTMVSYDPLIPYDQQKLYCIDPTKVMQVAGDKLNAKLTGDFATEFTIDQNGRILQLPEVASKSHWGGGSDEFYIELEPNQFWVMGDNRRGSTDSRAFGPIKDPHALIHWRIWSHDSDEAWWIWDLIKHPIDFWARMRWNRFFDVLQ